MCFGPKFILILFSRQRTSSWYSSFGCTIYRREVINSPKRPPGRSSSLVNLKSRKVFMGMWMKSRFLSNCSKDNNCDQVCSLADIRANIERTRQTEVFSPISVNTLVQICTLKYKKLINTKTFYTCTRSSQS